MTSASRTASQAIELAESLEARARALPLAGPKTRVTQEVRDWATTHERSLDDPGLLEAYSAAAERAPAELRSDFAGVAGSHEGRQALQLLLGRAGAADEVRLAALDALEPVVTAHDAPELARINTGQRPAVVTRALEVLAATASATALFALRKVYALRQDCAETARDLASELEELIPEARAAQDPNALTDELDDRELLLCLLALPAVAQADTSSSQLPARVVAPTRELDNELSAEAKRSGSLGQFHSRLRDELVAYVLLSDMPDEQLQARSVDNLFRREDALAISEIVAALPSRELGTYAERALVRRNRRARPDRATLALDAVLTRQLLRPAVIDASVDALADSEQSVVFAASKLLSVELPQLDDAQRAQLLRAYESLTPEQQRALAETLDLRVLERRANASAQGLVSWAAAAPLEEIEQRVSYLLDAWEQRDWSVDDVASVMSVLGTAADALPNSTDLIGRTTSTAATWLRSQPGRSATRAAVRALCSWAPWGLRRPRSAFRAKRHSRIV
jgi:hypothetical protein